ncbi:MAG: hypothetical protein JXB45_10945, partial [Candidatus Krumholzibacteriota bacterium]|nr:hypothetical protein [Candidatus Krumholzibacteriota bacterium]
MGSTTISGLEALEDKILRAAALIEKLQREKNEVLEENKVLKEKNDLLYISSEELKKELEIFKQDKDKDKDFDKTR